MSNSDALKKFNRTPSGRPSIVAGAKHSRGFVISPDQMLELYHDTQPGVPIPSDAQFQGIGLEDAGINSCIQFYFTSVQAPNLHCFALKPDYFFRTLVNLADGLLPLDSELDGIEISDKFTLILLRVKSSHWPTCGDVLPIYHLRYSTGIGGKQLLLVDPSKAIENERRILVH